MQLIAINTVILNETTITPGSKFEVGDADGAVLKAGGFAKDAPPEAIAADDSAATQVKETAAQKKARLQAEADAVATAQAEADAAAAAAAAGGDAAAGTDGSNAG